MEHPTVLLLSVFVVVAASPTAVVAAGPATVSTSPADVSTGQADVSTSQTTGSTGSAGRPAVAAQPDPVTLTVTVVDRSGSPVGDVTLVASWDGGSTTETTRSNGMALIDVPEGTDVTIRIEGGQYVRNQPYEVQDASGREHEIDVALRGSATVRVVGTTGQPIQGAIVRLWEEGNPAVNTRTNADGVVEATGIERGEYSLVVFKEGYFQNRTDVSVTPRLSSTVTIEQGSVEATFTVRDDHFSPPAGVEGARVAVGDIGTVRTLGNGEATISVPVNDRYEVTITKPNYTEATMELVVDESPVGANATIRRNPDLTVEPANERVVVGESVDVRVTNAYDEPVADAGIRLDGNRVGETGSDGRLRLTIESPGTHTVVARFEGLQAETTVEGVRAATPTPTPTPSPTPTPTPTPSPTPTDEPSSVLGPGFTPVTALAAVVVLALLARRRR